MARETDPSTIPEPDRRVVEHVRRQMTRLGFELTAVTREPGAVGRWQAHWRVDDGDGGSVSYGASGETARAAARTALDNARSSLADQWQ